MLLSSFILQNATLITPLLKFYLELGLVSTKLHFQKNTPREWFNSFVKSAVEAIWQRNEIPFSSVVEETMMLLESSLYGYQILDRSRHTVIKNLKDEKTHAATKNKLFKKLKHLNKAILEVGFAKAEIEYKGPTIVGFSFFNTQNSECWNPSTNFSIIFVMYTGSKSFGRIQLLCILRFPWRNWKIASEQK